MSQTNNYYQEILKEIRILIDQQKYEKAYWMARNELEMPYVPRDIELELIELFKQTNAIINEKNGPQIKINWTLEDIEKIMLDPFDEEIHLVAFQYLREHNVRKILGTIKNYLMNSLYRNESKIHLLFVLKEQDINEPLQVKKTHGVFTLNPVELVAFHDNPTITDLKKKLDSLVYVDNPSLYNICLYILENYYYAMYPELLLNNNDQNTLTAAVIYKANLLCGSSINLNELVIQLDTTITNVEKYLTIITQEQIL